MFSSLLRVRFRLFAVLRFRSEGEQAILPFAWPELDFHGTMSEISGFWWVGVASEKIETTTQTCLTS